MTGALALLILACGSSAPPPPLASERAPATAVVTAPPAAAPTGEVWTPERLDQLQPVPPTRQGRAPRPIMASPELEATLAWLQTVVKTYDADPQNPWAVAHGLLAMGRDLTLTDGRPAIQALFADFGEIVTVGGHAFVHFPRERGEVRVEPHMSLLLKALTEGGVPPTTPVTVQGKAMTAADLFRGTLATTYLDVAKNHTNFASPDDMPWALQGIAAWAPPGDLSWVSTDGTPTDLRLLTRFTVAVLVKETQFMADAMAQGQDFKREGQGIFKYTCGGAHILQGAAYAVAKGYGKPSDEAAIRAQVPLMFYRFPRELAITDAAIADLPEHRLRLLVQRLKFTGHYLESMEKLAALGFYSPDDTQQAALETAASEVVKTASTLRELKVTDHLADIKAQDLQLYLDVIGDSAHAVRGLDMALGRGTIPY